MLILGGLGDRETIEIADSVVQISSRNMRALVDIRVIVMQQL